MPLVLAPKGENLQIVRVAGNQKVSHHLENLGITSGAVITLLSQDNGNMIVRVHDSRLALDRDVAKLIIVRPAA